MEKVAIIERLIRLGAQDIKGTPRLVMRHRSPEELAQIQGNVSGALEKMQAPVKRLADKALDSLPADKLQPFVHAGGQALAAFSGIPSPHYGTEARELREYGRKGLHTLVENPHLLPLWAKGVPGTLEAGVGAKMLAEKAIDRFAPLPQGIPYTKSAMAALLEDDSDEGWLAKLAAMGVGPWWEQVGGPHLAKGGSTEDLKKMMEKEGLPPHVQAKFLRVAEQDAYRTARAKRGGQRAADPKWEPQRSSWAGSGPEPANPNYQGKSRGSWGGGGGWDSKSWREEYNKAWEEHEAQRAARAAEARSPKGIAKSLGRMVMSHPGNTLGAAAALGLGGRLAVAGGKDDPMAAPQRWKGRLGAYMTAAPVTAAGYQLGHMMGGNRGALYGTLAGGGLNALLGEAGLRAGDQTAERQGRRAAGNEKKEKKILEQASMSSAAHGRKALPAAALSAALGSVLTPHYMPLEAGAAAVGATGEGLLKRYHSLVSSQALGEAKAKKPTTAPGMGPQLAKAAASAPTRGGFYMASDIPSFRPPRLDQAIQKNSGGGTPSDLALSTKAQLLTSDKTAAPVPAGALRAKGFGRLKQLYKGERLGPLSDYAADLKARGENPTHPQGGDNLRAHMHAAGKVYRVREAEADAMRTLRKAVPLTGGAAALGLGALAARSLGGKSKPKEKDADSLPDGVSYWGGGFRPANLNAKHAMSAEVLRDFANWGKAADVSPAVPWDGHVSNSQRQQSDIPPFRAPRLDRAIQKTAGPGITPMGRLESTGKVGAPKASPPPGPSIADIAKPKGANFGTGIAGAFKGSIGGTAPQDLGLK